MYVNKKLMTLAGSAVLMAAAGTASAAPVAYTTSGFGATYAPNGAFCSTDPFTGEETCGIPVDTIVAQQSVEGSGVLDIVDGVFNGGTWSANITTTSGFNDLDSTTYSTYDINADGSGTLTSTSCVDLSLTNLSCDQTPGAYPAEIALLAGSIPFDFSDLNDINWLTLTVGTSEGLGGEQTDTYVQYHLTPSAVPVPAAAWLFGSALVGLAGVGRRRG
jgi:hypothetical protein